MKRKTNGWVLPEGRNNPIPYPGWAEIFFFLFFYLTMVSLLTVYLFFTMVYFIYLLLTIFFTYFSSHIAPLRFVFFEGECVRVQPPWLLPYLVPFIYICLFSSFLTSYHHNIWMYLALYLTNRQRYCVQFGPLRV